MNDNQYLQNILDAQTLDPDGEEIKALRAHRKDVEALLSGKFKDSALTIRYGGSKAKGTMIVEAYDLDLIAYFDHDDTSAGDTLKDIYFNVETALASDYLIVRKPSALRLKSKDANQYGVDFHIDVVPGRYVDDTQGDTFLYQSTGDKERLKTNLDVHITHVKDSGVIDAIRLLKLWRVRNALPIKHFALELLAIELLKDKRNKALSDQLTHVWTELRDNLDAISIEDPANPTGNDLSELLNDGVRSSISAVAKSTLTLIADFGWEKVFGPVEETESESKASGLRRAAAVVTTPSKPWSRPK